MYLYSIFFKIFLKLFTNTALLNVLLLELFRWTAFTGVSLHVRRTIMIIQKALQDYTFTTYCMLGDSSFHRDIQQDVKFDSIFE